MLDPLWGNGCGQGLKCSHQAYVVATCLAQGLGKGSLARWTPWTVSLQHGPNVAGQALLTLSCPQLPVPLAVLFLLSKERLLTCTQRKPLLLSADELALETRPAEKEDTSSLAPKFQPHPGACSCNLFWLP